MFEAGQHLRVQVAPAGQAALVQRLEHPGLEQRRHQGGVEHHQVIAGAAWQQLALHRLVGVEGVVDHLDAGGFLEVGEGAFAHVVRPVVQAQGIAVVRRAQGRRQDQRRAKCCNQGLAHVGSTCVVVIGSPVATLCRLPGSGHNPNG
ncbi:hypothetical protein D3C72_1661190 [compost metagenome]